MMHNRLHDELDQNAEKSITFIIPAADESEHIQGLVGHIKEKFTDARIIVVDDGSINHCSQQISADGVHIIRHPYNMGNGAAVKSGIRAAAEGVLIFMDADGQHDPSDVPQLLNHLNTYDMVVGARTRKQHASLTRSIMNRIFNRLASYVTGFAVEDLTSGFRAMRAELAQELLALLPNGYSWPTTATLVLLRSGMSVKYVPIHAKQRQYGRSRIRPIRDGIRFMMIILKICTLYSPMKIFLPVSCSMFVLGLINYGYTYLREGRFTNMSALMFTTAVIIFMMGLISEQISQIGLLRQHVVPSRREAEAVSEGKQPTVSS